ncbi:hypothetical protein CDAR_555771 [Caerostris darwini]|uniref:Uncharacterized protein n=1 Tax=Caerostris darwini TaxID=1538125 RepID=A0AAV4T5C6_9ARAC|nr:hypothetical protein CDAR_555771 [Caerostris darwini]
MTAAATLVVAPQNIVSSLRQTQHLHIRKLKSQTYRSLAINFIAMTETPKEVEDDSSSNVAARLADEDQSTVCSICTTRPRRILVPVHEEHIAVE